jgi:hypothetical protein
MTERFYHNPIRGGGLFLKWEGTGIAIDPGVNFVENMHLNGITVMDIDIVIITHNHIDHNGDVKIIDDLLHNCKKTINGYCDIETKAKFRNGNISNINFTTIDSTKSYKRLHNNIKLNIVATQHCEHSFGFILELKDRYNKNEFIGYTSDTKYFVSDFYRKFNKCKLLFANISEISHEDYLHIENKRNHLGYDGCYNLIKGLKNNNTIFLITEFWAGKGDFRVDVVCRLRQETNYKSVFPADIGMLIFIDKNTSVCSICKREVSIDKLFVIRPFKPFATLSYSCYQCII